MSETVTAQTFQPHGVQRTALRVRLCHMFTEKAGPASAENPGLDALGIHLAPPELASQIATTLEAYLYQVLTDPAEQVRLRDHYQRCHGAWHECQNRDPDQAETSDFDVSVLAFKLPEPPTGLAKRDRILATLESYYRDPVTATAKPLAMACLRRQPGPECPEPGCGFPKLMSGLEERLDELAGLVTSPRPVCPTCHGLHYLPEPKIEGALFFHLGPSEPKADPEQFIRMTPEQRQDQFFIALKLENDALVTLTALDGTKVPARFISATEGTL